ncbi:SDR family oxidoreductase [Lentibacillus halophilus]|uniref:SDR family oxidoreductase n=1 Tax=Lentibacillus halophilus TaxID=295065 RepID=A0ABN0Z6M0_9BACI
MTKILVTGSTGNIGSYVVDQLLQKEVTVKAAVRDVKKGKQFFSNSHAEVTAFDFLRPQTYKQALEDVTKIFLMRPPHLSSPEKDMLPFLESAKAAGVEHIVFVSLFGVEKNPFVPHRKIESFIRDLGFNYTFLRPGFFMQNLNTTHRKDLLYRGELFIPAGNAKTNFIDTRDIAACAAVCLTDHGYINKAYTLTGNEAITYYQAASIMSDVLHRDIIYTNPGLLEFRKAFIKRGTPKTFANVMMMLYLMTKLGTAEKVTDEAEKLLGRKPITFRQYVEDHAEFFERR